MTAASPAQTVLFVEDDDALRFATVQALELAGFRVRAFADAPAALAAVTRDLDGVVVSDIRMPRMDGLELLAAVRGIDPELPVILVTGHGDVPMAVAALKDGAYDFLTKPFAADHLAATVRRGLERRGLGIENRRLRAAAEAADSPLIGESAGMVALREAVRRLAEADVDVLIEGETGTGKDLVATLLHRLGPRRARPCIAVDCAALPEEGAELALFGHAADSVPHTRLSRQGQIAAAHGGTLVLDGIEALSPLLQARLLRVIEDREVQPVGAERAEAVSLRIVATSTVDLAAAAAAGRFRSDLYHRLAWTRLRLPPLREREKDRLILHAGFVEEARRQLGRPDYAVSDAERRHVLAHDWPGNIRELRNFAFDAVLSADAPRPLDPATFDLRSRVHHFEATIIADALHQTGGNVIRALDLLKLPRKTLYDKLARHGIDPDRFRPGRRDD